MFNHVCVCLLRPYSVQCNERWLQCLTMYVCVCYDRTVRNVTKGSCVHCLTVCVCGCYDRTVDNVTCVWLLPPYSGQGNEN